MYTNDILGNRTWRNEASATRLVRYTWDVAGRLIQTAPGATYEYRADGMRIKKVTGFGLSWQANESGTGGFYNEVQDDDNPTYRYRYDGQMCFEDDFTTAAGGGSITGNSYALGARGIDMIRTFTVNTSTYARTYDSNGKMFPLYDGHGNMIATVGRSTSSPYFSIGNTRSFDVWGSERASVSSPYPSPNGPDSRYCANLGHKSDDESGLIYMRARYYEPASGRFISEDPAGDGFNWFAYCANDPVSKVDFDGKQSWFLELIIGSLLLVAGFVIAFGGLGELKDATRKIRACINQARAMGQAYEKLGMLDDLVDTLAKQAEEPYTARRHAIKATVAGIVTAIFGISLILRALLSDIDLAPQNVGALDLVFGD